MTYNKLMGESFNVGIISIPDFRESSLIKFKIRKTIRETIALIYYSVILLPYYGVI